MNRRLSALELARVDAPVGDVRLDPVPLAQRAGELAQAPHPLAEHDHLLLAGDAGQRLGGHAAQERQPVPSPTHRLGDEPLADECGRERRLRVGQRLWVDARVDEHTDVPEHDSLHAGEFGQRLPVEVAPGFERLQLAQDVEQTLVGLAASAADRVEQLGERGVRVERERLRGADLGHPRLHVPAGDADEVRAVVDAQAVGVDLVHQVTGLAGVQPLGDHRLIARPPGRRGRRGARRSCRAASRSRSQQSATDPNRTCASAWCASVAGLA